MIALALLLIASCSAEEPAKTGRLDKGDMAPKWTGIDLVSGQQNINPRTFKDNTTFQADTYIAGINMTANPVLTKAGI